VKCAALIPARGGSKRLPGKNIADFLGRPMIAYTIDAALETGFFADVVVSTEDEKIAEAARQAGARVSVRPEALAGDKARVTQVCGHFLEEEKGQGRTYDVLCCLYATAPLRNSEDIAAVVELVTRGDCAYAMAVTRYHYPPHQALKLGPAGSLSPMWPEWLEKRSQEVPEVFVDNGSTYAVSVPAFLESGTFYGPGLKGHLMPRERSVDIDHAEDLALALYFAGRDNR